MEHLHFTTLAERADQRPEFWSDISGRFFGRLKVTSLDDEPLDAELDAYHLGALRLVRIEAPAHRVIRDSDCGDLPTDDVYKLVLQLGGRAEICMGDRRFTLRPGDWSLYDPRVPYTISNFERASLLVAQIPRTKLKGFKVPNLHTSEASESGVIGLYSVFGGFLRSLSEQLPQLPDGVGQSVGESILGLLASTLSAYQEQAVEHATLPAVLKLRVLQYVHTHLAEPDLSIDQIARDLRCSKRYLHRVFEDEQLSLERQIWQARLERCAAALRASTGAHRPVSEVAFSWGFNSSAHFCRLFKSRYGVSPRSYRQSSAVAAAVQ